MPSKDKKKASSSKTKSSSSSSSKKDSSKDKKKKSSSSKRGSKSKSPSRRRKSSVTEDEEQPGPTAVGAMTAPSAVMPSSSADQQDPKASSDFEAGLLFQRFARNGGVDAKDFQRMWREREHMPLITGTPFGGGRNSSEGEAAQERRGQEGGRGGGGGIEPEKVFEFGQLFQQFDTDGDGRLGRADFERMIGGMLERLGGNHGGNRGEAGREAAVNNRGVPPAPPPLTPPPPPPPPSPSPVGPSITHYDETTGVPLAREAVASQQALGHTVVPLGDAYSRRLSLLQSLASSRLMPVRERLLQLRRRFQGRGEEVRAAKAAIERETLADANAIVERLRSVEALKQATLVQGINSVTAELEGVEKLSDQVARVTALPPSAPKEASPSSAYVPEFEETEKMVELVQSYRELCTSINRVASRPFASNIDVKADDFRHETAERLEVLRRADRYEQALSVKDQMLWVALQDGQRLEAKCEEERGLGQEFAEEAQEWVKLTGKLSDRVNALTAETDQMSKLRKTNESLVRENQELLRRLETLERDTGSM